MRELQEKVRHTCFLLSKCHFPSSLTNTKFSKIFKFVRFLLPSSSWLLELNNEKGEWGHFLPLTEVGIHLIIPHFLTYDD